MTHLETPEEFFMSYADWAKTFNLMEVVHLDADTARDEPSLNGKMFDMCIVVNRVLRLWRNMHWEQYASFDSLISRAGLRHLGKRWVVRLRDTATR